MSPPVSVLNKWKNQEAMAHRFYDALGAGEHGAHNSKVLGVRHSPLAHVFKDFSSGRGSQGVLGVEADIGIDTGCKHAKRSSEDKPCGKRNALYSNGTKLEPLQLMMNTEM